jgi:hypothetical protein
MVHDNDHETPNLDLQLFDLLFNSRCLLNFFLYHLSCSV